MQIMFSVISCKIIKLFVVWWLKNIHSTNGWPINNDTTEVIWFSFCMIIPHVTLLLVIHISVSHFVRRM